MKFEDLLDSHSAAGKRYTAATIELHDAFVELAALDEVLANGNVGHADAQNIRSFVNTPQNLGSFQHPKFAPIDPAICWRDQIKSRRDEPIAALARGE